MATYQTSPAAIHQTGVGAPFPGLAYTMFVEGDGTPKLAWSLSVRTWHSGATVNGVDRNSSHVGICYAGAYSPNDAQKRGLAACVRYIEQSLGHTLDWEGHGDVYPTACPGPTRELWIPEVLRLAREG